VLDGDNYVLHVQVGVYKLVAVVRCHVWVWVCCLSRL
jgi:hypothetical protein